jgi:copper chaperone
MSLMTQLGRARRRLPARQIEAELDLAIVARSRMATSLIKRRRFMQVFNVQGMSCGHCVRAITQALQARDPAASVRVDLAAKEVGVESALSADEVISLISEEGYAVKLA